jgi:alkylated DNA repair dioxygenase AlkB
MGCGTLRLEGRVFFLSPEEIADTILAALLAELPWERRITWMYGKDVPVPRMEVWVADHAYTYSHRTYQPISWPPTLLKVEAEIEAAAGSKCNSVLVNRYENEKDSGGWHATCLLPGSTTDVRASPRIARHFM